MAIFYNLLSFALLAFILLFKVKVNKNGEWDKDYFSLERSGALRGFAALCIIFHHMSQRTAAPWLNPQYIRHGLDIFVNVGLYFVAIFFFASGFGLYKGLKSKEDYLKGFLGRHLPTLIVELLLTSGIFYFFGHSSHPYSWYIYAIIYLYIAFFLIYRFVKNDKSALIILTAAVIIYMLFCDFMMMGVWWINTVGLFPLGIFYAMKEEKILASFKEKYALWCSIMGAVTVVFFILSRLLNDGVYSAANYGVYLLSSWGLVITQLISSVSFVILILLISLKISFKNSILSFLGKMTLEIYLVHGIFVQAFSFAFVNPEVKPLYYIKSVPLYVIAVLITSLAASFILYKIRLFAKGFFTDRKELTATIKKDLKKIFKVIIVIILIITVFNVIRELTQKNEYAKVAASYGNENISYIDINGKKMAYYHAGEGTDPVIILRGDSSPCPTLFFKTLADNLGKEYDVYVLDFLGTGYSDNPDTLRNMENITDEIHKAVAALDIDPGYILAAQGISGAYSRYYVNQYPGEVKAIIGMDAKITGIENEMIKMQRIAPYDYKKYSTRTGIVNASVLGFLRISGYESFIWPVYQRYFEKSIKDKDLDAPHYFFVNKFYNKYDREELKNEFDSLNAVNELKYPEDVTVINIVSNGYAELMKEKNIDIEKHYQNISTNPENSFYHKVVDMYYCMLWNPEAIKEIMDKDLK